MPRPPLPTTVTLLPPLLAALLARRERVAALLTAIENKTVSAGQISAARRTWGGGTGMRVK